MINKEYIPTVNQLIASNLTTLIAKPNLVSPINPDHLDLLQTILYSTLTNIKLSLVNNETTREASYSIFESEWKQYHIDIHKRISKRLITPYYLITSFIANEINDPNIKLKKKDSDQLTYYIITFMPLYDLKLRLLIKNTSDFNPIHSRFPLGNEAFETSIEQKASFISKAETYKCQMKKDSSKIYSDYTIVIYLNFIFFCSEDIIKHKYPLREIECIADKSNTNALNIDIKDKEKYIQMSILFSSPETKEAFKERLNKLRQKTKEEETKMLCDYFDNLILEINIEKNEANSNSNINLLGFDL